MSAIIVLVLAPLALPVNGQSLNGVTVTLDVNGSVASSIVGPGVEFDPAPSDVRFSLDVTESGEFRLYNNGSTNVLVSSKTYRLALPGQVTGASLASTNVGGIDSNDVTWAQDSVSLNVSGTTWGAGSEALVELSFIPAPADWMGDSVQARSLGDIFDVATAGIDSDVEFQPAPGFAPLAIDVGSDFIDFTSLTDDFNWDFDNRQYEVGNISENLSTGVIVGISVDAQDVTQLPAEPVSFTERAVVLYLEQSSWADESNVRIDLALSVGNAMGREVTARGSDGVSSVNQVSTVSDAVEFPSLTLAPELELDVGRSSVRIRNTGPVMDTPSVLHYAVDGLDWSGLQVDQVFVETHSVDGFNADRVHLYPGCVAIDLSGVSLQPDGEIYLGLQVSGKRVYADRFGACTP